jgi:nickel-dependent lactate racemase
MDVSLPYGTQSECGFIIQDAQTVNLPPQLTIAGTTATTPLVEIVNNSLNNPTEFPALSDTIFPGDTLAIAVEADLPKCGELLHALLSYLRTNTVLSANDITIIYGGNTNQFKSLALPEKLANIFDNDLKYEVHLPEESEKQAFLATAKNGEPIRFNKTLVDVDIVIPLSVQLPNTLSDHTGFYHCLYPTFADHAAQSQTNKDSTENETHPSQDALTTAAMLGVQFIIKVTPGIGDEIVNFSAGEIKTLASQLDSDEQLYPEWNAAQLTVGTISGHTSCNSWETIARALNTLADVTLESGTIVLCTEMADEMPSILNALRAPDSLEDIEYHLEQQSSPHLQIARTLFELRDLFHICLLSNHDPAEVESLGIAPIEDVTQIQKLVDASPSINCVIDAHRITFR